MWDKAILAQLQGYGADIGCGMDACPKATHLIDMHPEVSRRYHQTNTVHALNINDGFPNWKDDLFDFVVCKNALDLFDDQGFILDEMIRITKPSGKVWFTTKDNRINQLAKAISIDLTSQTAADGTVFYVITNPETSKKFFAASASEAEEQNIRIREFGTNSIWPLYISPPRYKKPLQMSVVIATYGQSHLTVDCLNSIFDTAPADVEIIVVDNASPDDTLEKLKPFKDKIKLIKLKENIGCAGAWNIGLREASGDLLGVLNNDVTIHKNGLQDIGAEAWRVGIACWHAGTVHKDLTFAGHSAFPYGTDFPNGCALFFRRDVFKDVGPFDDEMRPGYSEDSDWGFRARLKGYGWAVCPHILYHHHESTAKHVPGIKEARERNFKRLYERWKDKGAGESILVRRWAAAGDVLMLTPALAALRKKKPLAHIQLQCAPQLVSLFDGISSVDVVSDKANSHYTTTYNLDDAYEEARKKGEWIHPTLAYAQKMGLTPECVYYEAAPTVGLESWANKILLKHKNKTLVALVPRSAGRSCTNWSEDKWVELVRMFPEYTFVVLDGASMPSLEVHGKHKGARLYFEPNVLDLTGKTPTLKHAMAIIKRCKAGIGVDTGVTHMLNAAKLPAVVLIGATAGWARGPMTGQVRILQGVAPCYPCKAVGACPLPKVPHCLGVITPEIAANNLREII